MSGYYFILTEFSDGRYGYSERKYKSKEEAEASAAIKRGKAGVKSAKVKYQSGANPVDIKKFI